MVDELAGPLAYSALWSWILITLTALPVTWWTVRRVIPSLLRWSNRRSRTDILRERSLKLISAIEQRHAGGELTSREANVELSIAVRQFVSAATGAAVDVMTLAEIEGAGDDRTTGSDSVTPLVTAIRIFYNGAFDSRPDADLSRASQAAREVVSTWI